MRGDRETHLPTAWALLRIWTGIGLQSFGGGASTQLLIRRVFVERGRWITDEELLGLWNLCQFTPGINLIALTILIGRRLGGPWGILASLVGMLLPSAAVTCLLAAGFEAIRHSVILHAVLRGVIPATAGIMAVVGLNFARPVIREARREGRRAIALAAALVAAGAAALIVLKLSVVIVLVGLALLGVGLYTPWRRPVPRQAADDGPANPEIAS
ncbi:MAG: chromate transporter [Chloroflexota bacterium]